MTDHGEDGVRHAQVEVLDHLHVIGGENHANVAEALHLATLETRQADSASTTTACDFKTA